MSTSARLRRVEEELARTKALLAELQRASTESHKVTAGQLRQVQQDLAASQADLTKVLAERDWEREVVGMLRRNEEIRAQVIRERNAERDRLREDLAAAQTARLATERERNEARHDLAHAAFEIGKVKTQRDLARAGLASALVELDHLRAELREAYALLPNRDENRGRP